MGSNGNYWSSSVDGTNARNLNFNSSDANMNSNNRANGNSVRCVQDWCVPSLSFKLFSSMQFKGKLLYDIYQAYFDARKNKRNSLNALAFEIDYEKNLFQLYEEIKKETYKIGPSICFMVSQPVKREIFAADFRDRIVHHLIYNYINPIFDKIFIYDSYSCRKGKGTFGGIKRLNHFIHSCSQNYRHDCYVLKIDIRGYFMSIDQNILYEKIKKGILSFRNEVRFDIDFILRLIHKIVFYDPTKNCEIRGNKNKWKDLPENKSLFFVNKNKGLPIGNLTSQLFGNVYLNDFDHFVKNKLKIKYYGRYVDDIVLVHQSKEYLKSLVPILKDYLSRELFLELHPNKIYLQHFSKGVNYLGVTIKPYCVYISKRTKGNFYQKIHYWNNFLEKENGLTKERCNKLIASINSYLGIMIHYNTYKLRKKILTKNLSLHFGEYIYLESNYTKVVSKKFLLLPRIIN